MKFVRMMILALGLLTLVTATSFAIVPFSTTATTNMVASNAATGLSGAIYYYPLQTGTVAAGEIINISYPVAISYTSEIQVAVTSLAGTRHEVFGAALAGFTTVSGAFSAYGATQTSTTSNMSVTLNQQTILIAFGSAVGFTTELDSISINGVRLDFSAYGSGTMTASLSNTIGQATESNPSPVVATLADALATPTTASVAGTTATGLNFYSSFAKGTGTGTIGVVPFNTTPTTTATWVPQNLVTVTLRELFPNGFDTKGGVQSQYSRPDTQISLNLSGIPTGLTISGVTLAGVTYVSGGTVPVFVNDGTIIAPFGYAAAPNANPIVIDIQSQAKNALDGVQVGISFSVMSGVTNLALNPAAITYTATLAPTPPVIQPGFPGAGGPDYPYNVASSQSAFAAAAYNKTAYKFVSKTVSGSIPVIITSLQTNLLSVFNEAIRDSVDPTQFLYDTGIAISNTSGTSLANGTGAPASLPGTITVTLYPMDGISAVKSFTTGSDSALRPGLWPTGNTTGALGPGQTWVVLLSQLLTPAQFPSTASFRGFIRFQCNFQGGIGINYIADGDFVVNGTAQGYMMLSDVPTVTTNLSGSAAGYF